MLYPLRLDVGRFDNTSPTLIDIDLVKRHCRVDFADDDDLLNVYIAAAVGWCEAVTDRTIFSRSHTWVLRDFERDGRSDIRLPRGNTLSVESITYVAGGTTTTLTGPTSSPAGTSWQEDLRSDFGGVLMPSQGSDWPSVDDDAISPVVISFTAGWATTNVPEELLYAIWFGIADAYDLRGSNDLTPALLSGAGSRLASREALISQWRLTRVY